MHPKCLFLSICMFLRVSGMAFVAEAGGEGEIEMRAALQEMDQQAFQANFVQVGNDAYVYIRGNIVLQRDELRQMVQLTLSEQEKLGNYDAVAALRSMLQCMDENEEDTFDTAYQKLYTVDIDMQAADEAALQEILTNYENDFENVKKDIEAYENNLLEERKQLIRELRKNPGKAQQKESYMPNVPDGTIARIFFVEDGGYYVDAGSFSDAYVGMQCPVVDADGEYRGNLELIYCFPTFSVGVPLHTIDIGTGMQVPNLMTQKEARTESE